MAVATFRLDCAFFRLCTCVAGQIKMKRLFSAPPFICAVAPPSSSRWKYRMYVTLLFFFFCVFLFFFFWFFLFLFSCCLLLLNPLLPFFPSLLSYLFFAFFLLSPNPCIPSFCLKVPPYSSPLHWLSFDSPCFLASICIYFGFISLSLWPIYNFPSLGFLFSLSWGIIIRNWGWNWGTCTKGSALGLGLRSGLRLGMGLEIGH